MKAYLRELFISKYPHSSRTQSSVRILTLTQFALIQVALNQVSDLDYYVISGGHFNYYVIIGDHFNYYVTCNSHLDYYIISGVHLDYYLISGGHLDYYVISGDHLDYYVNSGGHLDYYVITSSIHTFHLHPTDSLLYLLLLAQSLTIFSAGTDFRRQNLTSICLGVSFLNLK